MSGPTTGTPGRPGAPGHPGHTSASLDPVEPQEQYEQMLRLADLFDESGADLRRRAVLGQQVLGDPAVSESAPLSPGTYARAEDDVRAATIGKDGLLSRSVELDADALVLRATVHTYRWIDDLQAAAYATLGSIAGRALGYLAPEVALGGAIVSAGLIETDALDRDGVAAYLSELAESNPELMEHMTSGGGLLESLQMRSILTAGALAGEPGRLAGLGGRRAAGTSAPDTGFAAALRDVASSLVQEPPTTTAAPTASSADGGGGEAGPTAPTGLAGLLEALEACVHGVRVERVAPGRFLAYLTGPGDDTGRRLRLVGGDQSSYAAGVVRAIEEAVTGEPDPHVMLIGAAQGGVAAVEIAARGASGAFVVDQVVTAGAPSAHVRRLPDTTRVLALEDRGDPVAVLGSLINARDAHRVTLVFDGATAAGRSVYVAGARAADESAHPDVRAEMVRLRELGYLAG